MKAGTKNNRKNTLSRILIVILGLLLQTLISFITATILKDKFAWIDSFLRLSSAIIILMIIKNSRHLSSDILWIILIGVLPILGSFLYLFLGANLIISKTYRAIKESTDSNMRYYNQDQRVMKQLKELYPKNYGQFEYISKADGYPFYKNTGFDYYPFGEEGFPIMLEEMRKAEKFIFLEYFIIEPGRMWDAMLEIMEEKVKQGVEVRVMYDDLGSFFVLPASYAKVLEAKGIKCMPFNRISLILNIIINHRDHRKLMVIDGKVAFSGGINLADEYINAIVKYGRWKDNVIRIKGEAVWSYTIMFLTHWNALRKEDRTFLSYRSEPIRGELDGYIAPYSETPLDDEIHAQNIYVNILNQAIDHCYICTPYLIIDTDMINTLILAARRGVDVRLVTPGIPDKKMVYMITRSYYYQLIKGGVKVYEYDPGFVHAKVFEADDMVATVGTVNLDYRSLYLHFENGTYLYGSEKIKDIRKDLESMMEEGHQVSLKEARNGPLKEFFLGILRLFAPLM
ncbi:MAG: cardiolipin synthase [Erysipelotrichaceae bacterium]|nr:cardiolipin synthase [Erysipelotrichaceae bacterium]